VKVSAIVKRAGEPAAVPAIGERERERERIIANEIIAGRRWRL
jgi:hypothetical protein